MLRGNVIVYTVFFKNTFGILSNPDENVGLSFLIALLTDKTSKRTVLKSLSHCDGKSGNVLSSMVKTDAKYLLNSLATSIGNEINFPDASMRTELCRLVFSLALT
jgi:hypothetical protein